MYTWTLQEDFAVVGAPILRLYDPILTEYGVESPTLDQEANRFGTLTFTIYDSNPQYNKIKLRRSLIRVYRDGVIQTIMRPIIKYVNMHGGYEFTCEDLLGLLNDYLKRPETEPVTKTAFEFLHDNVYACVAKAGDSDVFIPSIDYFQSIMPNGNFKYLRSTNDLYPEYEYAEDGTVHKHTGRSKANIDLRRALAAVMGSSETGYTPKVTGYKLETFPFDEVVAYGKSKGFGTNTYFKQFAQKVTVWNASDAAACELYNNWRFIHVTHEVTVNGKTLYQTLKEDMLQFIADWPETQEEWETSTGFPISFIIESGDAPASGDAFESQCDAYTPYWDYIQETLIDQFGGYIVPVWGENSVRLKYVDEIDLPQSSQSVVFGENLEDLFIESDTSEQYTTIIPLGKDGLTVEEYNQGKDYIADEASFMRYGRKETTKEWPDIEDAQILYSTAVQWLLDHSMLLKDRIEVTAYDLRFAGLTDLDYLDFMHNVTVISERHAIEENYPVTQVHIIMDSPSANTYTLGSEPESLVDDVAEQAKKLDRINKRKAEPEPTPEPTPEPEEE